MVMGWDETRVPKIVGSNPSTIYWMDIFSHLFVVKIVMMFVCLKRPKITEKEAGVGPFLEEMDSQGSCSFLSQLSP